MKNHTFPKLSCAAAALVSLLSFVSCNPPAENNGDENHPDTTAAKAATLSSPVLTLNLCPNVVEVPEADTSVKNAYRWIVKSPDDRLNQLNDSIDRQALIQLNNEIITEHEATVHTCAGFVPAIKVFVGLQGKSLKLFYQPAYLCQVSQTNTTVDLSVNVLNQSQYKKYDNPNQEFVPAPEAGARLTEYIDNIRFKEPAATRTFNPAYDSTGDTRALIIPLQEILAVLKQNSNSPWIKIWHYAVLPDYAPADAKIRQSLLLGPHFMTPAHVKNLIEKNDASMFVLAGFANNYADRSHLCPPSCDAVQLIISDGTNDCQD